MPEIQSARMRKVVIPKDKLYMFSQVQNVSRQNAIHIILAESGFDMRYPFDVKDDVCNRIFVCTQPEYFDFKFAFDSGQRRFTIDNVQQHANENTHDVGIPSKRHIEKLK